MRNFFDLAKKTIFYFDKNLISKFFFFSFFYLSTFFLLYHYIDLNRNVINLLHSNTPLNEFMFWRYGIFIIILHMLAVNILSLTLYYFFIKEKNIKKKEYFFFPFVNSFTVLIIIVFGLYFNKNCYDLPKDKICGCLYVYSVKGKHTEAYKSLFNKKCFKNF